MLSTIICKSTNNVSSLSFSLCYISLAFLASYQIYNAVKNALMLLELIKTNICVDDENVDAQIFVPLILWRLRYVQCIIIG